MQRRKIEQNCAMFFGLVGVVFRQTAGFEPELEGFFELKLNELATAEAVQKLQLSGDISSPNRLLIALLVDFERGGIITLQPEFGCLVGVDLGFH
ncbi:MAG: hypothetical protein JST65_09985 [Acidobacteria bacterium]|nr:hypothetical protein [Acidobacteriota bacterium]